MYDGVVLRLPAAIALISVLVASCGGDIDDSPPCSVAADCAAGRACVDGRCVERPDGGGQCVDEDGDGYGVGPDCLGSDCDDEVVATNAAASELCDFADNDCDGTTDEGVLTTIYRDGDGDGHGDASESMSDTCAMAGWVDGLDLADDCDDAAADRFPGAAETCDGRDVDCDGNEGPCTFENRLSGGEGVDLFIPQGSSSCSVTRASGGARGVVVSCGNDQDMTLVLGTGFVSDPSTTLVVEVDAEITAAPDGSARFGIDLAGAEGATFGAWGASPGYGFRAADAHDSLGFACTSDRCPSILKDDGATQLALASGSASSTGLFHLVVRVTPTDLEFEVTRSGTNVASIAAADASYRDLRVGLHCGEGTCRFENLVVRQVAP